MSAGRDEAQRLPRPTPKIPYNVLVRSGQIRKDWDALLRNRTAAAIACWDHIANAPTQPVGTRYLPLKGEQSHCQLRDQTLRQWQWEIDRGARVKLGVGKDFVVIMGVWTGHPKENE